MKKNHYIITGTSRGIGEALARQLLGDDTVLICISRNENPRLTTEAYMRGYNIRELALDLCETHRIHAAMHEVFREINEEDVNEIVLINNAGTIHPIRETGSKEANEAIIRSVNVNLTSAMLITDEFIRTTQGWNCPRKVVNLSTGAARRSVHGWSAYCSAKAALAMYSHCIVEEQAGRSNPVKVMAFAPGVVDTEMQSEIRASNPGAFPELQKFMDYKAEGKLLDPEFVAAFLVTAIHKADFGDLIDVDIRDHIG